MVSTSWDGDITLWDLSNEEKWERLDSHRYEENRYGRVYINHNKIMASSYSGKGALTMMRIEEEGEGVGNKTKKLKLEKHFVFKNFKFLDPMWTNDNQIFATIKNNHYKPPLSSSSQIKERKNSKKEFNCPVCNYSFESVYLVESHIDSCLSGDFDSSQKLQSLSSSSPLPSLKHRIFPLFLFFYYLLFLFIYYYFFIIYYYLFIIIYYYLLFLFILYYFYYLLFLFIIIFDFNIFFSKKKK